MLFYLNKQFERCCFPKTHFIKSLHNVVYVQFAHLCKIYIKVKGLKNIIACVEISHRSKVVGQRQTMETVLVAAERQVLTVLFDFSHNAPHHR